MRRLVLVLGFVALTAPIWLQADNAAIFGNGHLPIMLNGQTFTSTGIAGTYSLTNSGLLIKNVSGTELLRLWASDPDSSNFNDLNLYLGYQAGLAQASDNVSAGYENVGIGAQALLAVTTGYVNVAVGTYSLDNLTTGHGNVGVGESAGASITTGTENIHVGNAAGGHTATGTQNVSVGSQAGPSTGALANTVALGYTVAVTASNRAVIGNASIADVYLGSETGAAQIHAAGLTLPALACPMGQSSAVTLSIDAAGKLTFTKAGCM